MKIRPKLKRMVGLTGTPAGNGLMDLFAEFKLLDMGERLGRFIGQYRNTYFQPDKRNGMVIYSYKPLPDAEQRIYDKISDITISMKATDHLTMPELVSTEYMVQLSDKEREKYDRLKKDLILSNEDNEVTAANAASLSNKLSQMANGAVYDGLTVRFDTAKARFDAVEDAIHSKQSRRATIETFLATLAEANLVDKFDTALWCGLVDYATVYDKDDVRFNFKNGQEIRA